MRLRATPLLVVIIAIVAVAGAWTDRPNVQVEKAPTIVQGKTRWEAMVKVTRRGRPLDGAKAVMTLKGPNGVQKVQAQGLGGGWYRVRVRTPEMGFYTYTINIGNNGAARGGLFSAG
jgi:hypothetical protein